MKKIVTLLFLLVFVGCFRGTSRTSTVIPSASTAYTIAGNFTSGESVYMVFTGTEINRSTAYNSIDISGNETSNVLINPYSNKNIDTDNQDIVRIDIGQRLRQNLPKLEKNIVSKTISRNISKVTVGDTVDFNIERVNNTSTSFPSSSITASAILVDTTTKTSENNGDLVGNKTVNVWLDTKYSDTIELKKLSTKFFNGSNSNDIYHWIKNIFGEEWMQTNYTDLIDDSNEINILFTDLNTDYTNSSKGYVMGYFNPADTYLKEAVSSSNEKNMFYIDIRLLNGDFSGTDTRKSEMKRDIYSTLAHEFVHMINHYQKEVTYGGISTDDWLNEMLAMVGEDLVDDKIEVDGVKLEGSKGRIAEFNTVNNLDINDKDGSYGTADYSIGAAYGLYLTRAYCYSPTIPSLDFITNIMHNQYSGTDAIDYAIVKAGSSDTFLDTVKNFGKAVILSSDSGSITASSKIYMNRPMNSISKSSIAYNFEAINIFDYGTFYYLADQAGVMGGANTYAELGTDLNGTKTWTFTVPLGVEFQIIVKNSDGTYNKNESEALYNSKQAN